jgi:hypothetical protein
MQSTLPVAGQQARRELRGWRAGWNGESNQELDGLSRERHRRHSGGIVERNPRIRNRISAEALQPVTDGAVAGRSRGSGRPEAGVMGRVIVGGFRDEVRVVARNVPRPARPYEGQGDKDAGDEAGPQRRDHRNPA